MRMSEAASRYYNRNDFRLEVLSQFLPPSSVAVYKDTLRSEARLANASAKSASPFVAEKARTTVDLSVFGIPLYEPLNLPECPPNSEDSTLLPGMFGIGRGGAQTCYGNANGGMAMLIAMMAKKMLGEKEQQAGYSVITARLADK